MNFQYKFSGFSVNFRWILGIKRKMNGGCTENAA